MFLIKTNLLEVGQYVFVSPSKDFVMIFYEQELNYFLEKSSWFLKKPYTSLSAAHSF
jgi:hypothetical protein